MIWDVPINPAIEWLWVRGTSVLDYQCVRRDSEIAPTAE